MSYWETLMMFTVDTGASPGTTCRAAAAGQRREVKRSRWAAACLPLCRSASPQLCGSHSGWIIPLSLLPAQTNACRRSNWASTRFAAGRERVRERKREREGSWLAVRERSRSEARRFGSSRRADFKGGMRVPTGSRTVQRPAGWWRAVDFTEREGDHEGHGRVKGAPAHSEFRPQLHDTLKSFVNI